MTLHKLLGLHFGKGSVESLNDHRVYSEGLKQNHLVLMGQDQPGRSLGRQELKRVRLEGQDHRVAAQGLRVLDHVLQQRLVPQMDAVEIPQRQDRPGDG